MTPQPLWKSSSTKIRRVLQPLSDSSLNSNVGKYHFCAIRLLGSLLAYRTLGRNRGQSHTDGHFHSPMKLTIPELAVVALVGPSGSGKSSFARKHFRPPEVLSSDS